MISQANINAVRSDIHDRGRMIMWNHVDLGGVIHGASFKLIIILVLKGSSVPNINIFKAFVNDDNIFYVY